jgi:hypothetical protein
MAKWNSKLLQLAAQYLEAVRSLNQSSWTVTLYAWRMRSEFPRKATFSGASWVDFCDKILKRNYKTIGAQLRAARYCKIYVKGWEVSAESGNLPAVYLIDELSGVKDDNARGKLHQLVFDSKMPAEELLRNIRRAKNAGRTGDKRSRQPIEIRVPRQWSKTTELMPLLKRSLRRLTNEVASRGAWIRIPPAKARLRYASELSNHEVLEIAELYRSNGGEYSFAGIEGLKELRLQPANGMTAKRIIDRARNLT